MCGIFGVLQNGDRPPPASTLDAAADVQGHRGPDGRGRQTYSVAGNTVVLAHQRLSIIDLSDAGLQPMERGELGSLTYNGELYNYLELRDELVAEGETFSTRTDTEVLLAALHRWGPERALGKFNWMGAFGWLDRSRAKLVLACDAGSEKPIYYYADEEQLCFASEIKTLLLLTGRKFALDKDSVGQFLVQGLTDVSPQTFFQGIRRVEAGHFIELDVANPRREIRPVRFQPPLYEGDPSRLSLDEFVVALRELFIDSVRIRLRSDVPVGVLLSGGLDSSSIAAVSQSLVGHDSAPRLLSAVSNDPRFDESRHIEAMERHLGQQAQKVNLRMAPERLMAELSDVNWYNDAPVAGLSSVAHYKLMARAKELGLTVILSGQGADEILLGYRKFLGFYLQSLVRQGRPLRAVGVLASFIANGTIVSQMQFADAKRYVPFLRRLGGMADGGAETSIVGPQVSGWAPLELGLGPGSLRDRQVMDIRHYSVPLLCHYEDRMSMAMSREIRLPFLDSRLMDLVLRAPDDYKLRRGWTKYGFRKAMEPLLPAPITWRKDKQGFANPEGEWLKLELRESVEEAFSDDSLIVRSGLVNGPALRRRYAQYRRQPVDGGSIWYREIFAPLSLELWMRRYAAWIA